MSRNTYNDPEFDEPGRKPTGVSAFSPLRVLIALLILGALGLLVLMPMTRTNYEAVRRVQCTNNLKQIGFALSQYREHYGVLPPAYTVDDRGRPLHSWRTLILPYLDEAALYASIDLTKPWNDPVNAKACRTSVGVFQCPSSVKKQGAGASDRSDYLAIVGDGCAFAATQPTDPKTFGKKEDVIAAVVEVDVDRRAPWASPTDIDPSTMTQLRKSNKLSHEFGWNVCFVDGSVHLLTVNISEKAARACCSTRAEDAVDPWEL